jgi:hypothetical protein
MLFHPLCAINAHGSGATSLHANDESSLQAHPQASSSSYSSSSFSYCSQKQSSIYSKNHSLPYLIWTLKSLHSHVITTTMPLILLVFSSPSFQERIIIMMMVMQLPMMMVRARNVRHINLLQVIIVILTVAQISVVLLGVIEKLSHGVFLMLLLLGVGVLRLFLFVLFSCHSI